MWGDERVNLMAGILSQYIPIHHIVHFKYLTILLENYTLIKLEKKVTEPETNKHWEKKNLLI